MKKTILRRLAAFALAALLPLSAAGCAGGKAPAAESDGSLQKVLDAGRLVLGLDASFPPMGFADESGEIVGFDIDVAREVCNRLGVELVKQPIDWDEKENDLNSGRIDCIWNGMSVTPARAESMNLSLPYMKNELIFVDSGASGVKGVGDLDGLTVGVQSGSTAQDVLRETSYYRDIFAVPLDDNVEMLKRLEEGKLDAVLLDSVVAYYLIFSSSETYYVLPNSLAEEEYAIGFRKNDRELRDKVQEIIGAMKEDGSLGEISKKCFGSDITTVK